MIDKGYCIYDVAPIEAIHEIFANVCGNSRNLEIKLRAISSNKIAILRFQYAPCS